MLHLTPFVMLYHLVVRNAAPCGSIHILKYTQPARKLLRTRLASMTVGDVAALVSMGSTLPALLICVVIVSLDCSLFAQTGRHLTPNHVLLCERYCGTYEVTQGWIVSVGLEDALHLHERPVMCCGVRARRPRWATQSRLPKLVMGFPRAAPAMMHS